MDVTKLTGNNELEDRMFRALQDAGLNGNSASYLINLMRRLEAMADLAGVPEYMGPDDE